MEVKQLEEQPKREIQMQNIQQVVLQEDNNFSMHTEEAQQLAQKADQLQIQKNQRMSRLSTNKKEKIDISWKDLQVNFKNPKTKQEKVLLQSQTGYIKSGEMLAIMGPSGAGKTTLLSLLIGRTENGNGITKSGQIFANSQPITASKLSRICSFVMQEDILLQTLTPRESLMFVANLRMKTSMEEKIKRVDTIIEMLQLKHCQNTLIGGPTLKGISGGERKRVSIAVELVSDPQIIVLDEPTSGLDSFTSFLVIQLLKRLAQESNKTIIFTIHSPNSDIFNIFDRLLLLRDGQSVFQGTKDNLIGYFDKIGLQIPHFSNPADFFMEVLNDHALSQKSLNYENYEKYLAPQVSEQLETLQTSEFSIEQNTVSFFTQITEIAKRALKNYLRNPMTFKARTGQTIFIAFIVCSLYFRLDLDLNDTENLTIDQFKRVQQNYGGVIFFLTLNMFMATYQNVILTFVQERSVFLREENSQLYQTSSYFLGKSIVEYPLLLANSAAFISIIYFIIGFNSNARRFFEFLFLAMIENIMGNSMGIMVGSLFTDQKLILALSPMFVIPQMYFAGFGANLPNMPSWLNWVQYIVPFKYLLEGYMTNQQGDVVYTVQKNISLDPLSQFEFKLGYWKCTGICIAITAIYMFSGYLLLRGLKKKIQ